MTYEEYWHGDVWAIESFRDAERLRQESQNYGYWLQGMYIYDGFSTGLANALSKKGASPKKYPEEPYPIFSSEKTEEEKEKIEETERLKAKLYMQNMVRAGKSWGK